MKKILIPLPTYGFDPTEVAIPWKLLTAAGFEIAFTTPTGGKASPDNKMLTGENLGVWRPVLQARKDAVDACREMQSSEPFCKPIKYDDIAGASFDGLLLPGGHDKGVKQYLESAVLQRQVVSFFTANKPVAAICHGVVLAARSIDPATSKSVIHEYKTTCLLNSQELLAYNLTRLWLGDYYLTYPEITVEDEVNSVLSKVENFINGPYPLLRDDHNKLTRGFFVKDRNYLSARWPGDAYNFSLEFIKMFKEPALI
jgi:putative intracellular protease/amidase